MRGRRRQIPSLSGSLKILPDPAIAAANRSLGTFSDHSDDFNSATGVEPVTVTRALSGGLVLVSVLTSADVKANGKITLPADRMAAAKPGSAFGSWPPNRISNKMSFGRPGETYCNNSVQMARVHGQRPMDSLTSR